MLPPAIRHTLGLVLPGYRDLVSATACERVSDYVTVLIKRGFCLGGARRAFLEKVASEVGFRWGLDFLTRDVAALCTFCP